MEAVFHIVTHQTALTIPNAAQLGQLEFEELCIYLFIYLSFYNFIYLSYYDQFYMIVPRSRISKIRLRGTTL